MARFGCGILSHRPSWRAAFSGGPILFRLHCQLPAACCLFSSDITNPDSCRFKSIRLKRGIGMRQIVALVRLLLAVAES
jgi:hypothetical protein